MTRRRRLVRATAAALTTSVALAAPAAADVSGVPSGQDAALVWLRSQVDAGTVGPATAYEGILAASAAGRADLARDMAAAAEGGVAGDVAARGAVAAASALLVADEVGADPTGWGGVDLVSAVASRVGETGRLGPLPEDPATAPAVGTTSQAYAAAGLLGAGESLAGGRALAFLRDQQCDSGGFAAALDGDCGAASVSATAHVVASLLGATDEADLAVVDAAVGWLAAAQRDNGSFTERPSGSAASTTAATALAGWALARAGHPDAAAAAGDWVRTAQLRAPAPCSSAAEGVVAARPSGVAALVTGGAVPASYADSTAAAARVLGLAHPRTDRLEVSAAPPAYVAGGSTKRLRVSGLDPGDTVCLSYRRTARLAVVGPDGAVTLSFALPMRTGTLPVVVSGPQGQQVVRSYRVLGRATFGVSAPSRARMGSVVKLAVTGAASGESLRVRVSRRTVVQAWANRAGKATMYVRLPQTTGRYTLVVKGKFPRLRSGPALMRLGSS